MLWVNRCRSWSLWAADAEQRSTGLGENLERESRMSVGEVDLAEDRLRIDAIVAIPTESSTADVEADLKE